MRWRSSWEGREASGGGRTKGMAESVGGKVGTEGTFLREEGEELGRGVDLEGGEGEGANLDGAGGEEGLDGGGDLEGEGAEEEGAEEEASGTREGEEGEGAEREARISLR